ncbi:MAG: hypothetical protein IH611_11370 [Deltaproteobacteria bacterium]|nr:hypothetical protein [Deltaproteobacteria bacterium]
MKNSRKIIGYMLYVALFVGTVWVSRMVYDQIVTARSEKTVDLATWLPKKQITRLMRFHGTDILKITPDEVFIPRGSKWVLVMRRDRN